MFATIRRYQVKSGSTADVGQRVQQGLIPLLMRQAGFASYYAVDAGNDVAMSVSLYQDRASAEAANKTAASWVQVNLSGLIGNAEVTVGEVIAQSGKKQ